jgi:DNA-binding NtrC family response regulator
VEVISAVRSALQRDLPVVLVTGDTSAAVRKLRSDPNLRFASKPINADELLTVMEELLQQQALSPAATSN